MDRFSRGRFLAGYLPPTPQTASQKEISPKAGGRRQFSQTKMKVMIDPKARTDGRFWV